MTGDTLDSWRALVANILIYSRTRVERNRCMIAMKKEHCGEKTHDKQVSYVKETNKPDEMSMDHFLKRLDSINDVLVNLKEGSASFEVEELNTQVISKAFP